jgi:hypothetical protein
MAEAATEPMVDDKAPPVPVGPPGVLRDRFLVRSNQPLAELSTPSADAFAAEDKRDPNRSLFALICRPDMPPRVGVMRALKGAQCQGMLQLIEWGPMNWPPAGRQCMTVIYDRPGGRKVMNSIRQDITRVADYDIGKKVVEPLITAIKELNQRGVTHRSIRPTNMFFMDGNGERMAFGECVTSPPAFDQPLLFETVESGMANPIARGSGTYSDDMYSLGVTLALLTLGRNPAAGFDDETLLRMKIQQGSYATLVGDERLPLAMIEILKGLLCDDPDQRWDFESVEMWLSGRRLSPLQSRTEKRAARGFPFLGKEYLNCRDLAMAMAKAWEQAIPPVVEGKLELWLRRAVEDKERAAIVGDVVRGALNSTTDKKVATDLMLCKILILLDPTAPIRYKGFNAMPDGFGSALATLMAQKGDNRQFTEILLREVPKLWFEGRPEYQPDNSLMDANFRELKSYLTQTGMGFGLERCLYELNDALPCQSQLVGEEYVVEVKELLPAISAAAAKRGDTKAWPIDRHVAAFMGARMRSDIDRNLTQLSDSDPGKGLMALLNLFAVLQYRLGPETLPGLATWVGNLCAPVIAAFHGREKRRELEKEVPRLVRKGSVVEIYNLLDNAEARDKDGHEFTWAQAQYHAAEEEVKRIQADDDERQKEAERTGKQTAAVTGIIIALVTVTVVTIMRVM